MNPVCLSFGSERPVDLRTLHIMLHPARGSDPIRELVDPAECYCISAEEAAYDRGSPIAFFREPRN